MMITPTGEHIKYLHAHYPMTKFSERAWPKIFKELLEPEKVKRWNFTGETNSTILRIYELAGRVMLTFERDKGESQVSYITHDKDATGESFGLSSYEGRLSEHIDAIDSFNRAILDYNMPLDKLFKYNRKQGLI